VRHLPFILAILALAACANGRGGIPVNPLTSPPWEVFVQAGPGAENDIDLETLDGPSAASAPTQDSIRAPDSIEPELEKPKKPKDPKAIAIKAVAVVPVRGTSNQGNGELTFAMRNTLRKAGWPVLEAARPDALVIEGAVKVSKPSGGMQTVTLTWTVKSPQGNALGDLTQSNEVPAGSLDKGWGENAQFATQAAADGIFKLIEAYR
jgi:hypothetical protein